MIVASPFLQSPYDLFAGDHRLALRPGDRVRECLFQRALLGLEAMELVYLQHTEGLGIPFEGVPHLPELVRGDLLFGELVEERADMSFLPGNHREASLPETLVDQAMLPECPEPIVSQEVQCLLAEVLPQDVLYVRDVLRKRGKVGEEPFRPFPAHMEFQRSLGRGLQFPYFARAPVPPLQKLRLLEWGWVIS